MNFYRKGIKFNQIVSLTLLLTLLISSGIRAEMTFNQSPELNEAVESGELPPIEERLPKEPLIVTPRDEIGQYGGTWNQSIVDMHWRSPVYTKANTQFTALNMDLETEPDVAKSWETNEDMTVHTITLREGHRWSDGEFFTAEDIRFYYEDLVLNENISTRRESKYVHLGEFAEFEVVDDYTIKFIFPETHATFEQILTRNRHEAFATPKHYLKKYHIDYADEAELQELVEESSYDTWYELFESKANVSNYELPVLYPWKLITEAPADRYHYVRNPYFHAVDTEGNQLPYIERVVVEPVGSAEIVNMRALAGDIDLQQRALSIDNIPLYIENQEEGDYKVNMWHHDRGGDPSLIPNHNVKDEVLNELFNNPEFKQAISIAIDRDYINETVFMGLKNPTQFGPLPGYTGYREEFQTAYIEYDPEKANQILDEIGLTEKDSDGYRLRPDNGERLHFRINDHRDETFYADSAELIIEYLREIGLSAVHRTIDGGLHSEQWAVGEGEMLLDGTSKREPTIVNAAFRHWGPLWEQWWHTDGERGVEPPEEIKRRAEIFDILPSIIDQEEADQLAAEMFEYQAENLYQIGLFAATPSPVISKNFVRNFPEVGLNSSQTNRFGPADVTQVWFDLE